MKTAASGSRPHLILLEYPAGGLPPTPGQMQEIMVRFNQWMDGLNRRGCVAGTNGLEMEGKILRGPIGETVITDGPFAEGKEVVGGYVLLHPTTAAEAMAIARACPGLDYGMTVEVRPVKEA